MALNTEAPAFSGEIRKKSKKALDFSERICYNTAVAGKLKNPCCLWMPV